MSKALILPFRIEALYLDSNSNSFSGTSIDYTQLPYHKSDGTIANASNPFIGDTVSKNAFNGTGQIPAGLHLHFILPAFLGRPIPSRCSAELSKIPEALKSGNLPAAPNRWLVKKTEGNVISYTIIQSDYIYAQDSPPDNVNFQSIIANQLSGGSGNPLPYCYMGTNNSVDLTKLSDCYSLAGAVGLSLDGTTTFKVLQGKPLTAIGSGDPYFSAYYPNCCTVFGFLDNTVTDLNSEIIFEVFGWHDDKSDDSIYQYIQSMGAVTSDTLIQNLQTNFSINIANTTLINDITPCIYYSKKIIDKKPAKFDFPNVELTMGRSVNEAVSAYLASNAADKTAEEEKLESISLIRNLEHLTSDIAFKLKESRHAQGFRKTNGGTTWVINAIENHSTLNTPNNIPSTEIPHQYDDLLNNLNRAQSAYDIAVNELVTMKEQLFLDYTTCQKAYTNLSILNEKLNTPGNNISLTSNNEADQKKERYQNEQQDDLNKQLPLLISDATNKKDLYKAITTEVLIDQINKAYNNIGCIVTLDNNSITGADNAASNSLANNLYTAWNAIIQQLATDKIKEKWALTPTPNESFWQPKAPAVLISGLPDDQSLEHLFSSDPNIKKGYHTAFTVGFDSSDPLSFIKNLIITQVGETCPIGSDSSITDYFNPINNHMVNYSDQSVTPFVLKWDIELNTNYPTYNANWNFGDDFLTSYPNPYGGTNTFSIAQNGSEFDFSNINSSSILSGQNIAIASTSILSPSGRKGMLMQMMHYLKSFAKKNDIEKTVVDSNTLQSAITSPLTENNIIAALVYGFMHQSYADFKTTVSNINKDIKTVTFSLSIHEVVINHLNTLLNNNFIAQTLSGFNHACMQRKITAQIPIIGDTDPFNAEYTLTNISNALSLGGLDYIKSSTDDSNNPFLPIQIGVPSMSSLSVIDNFGRKNHISLETNGSSTINYAESMKISTTDSAGFLFPRLSQAARLEFQWLSAKQNPLITPDSNNYYDASLFDTTCHFTNSVESSSPICGWLIPDYFNNEIMVYDADGQPLGSIDENANWRVPPFLKIKSDVDLNVQNEHLNRVVKWILTKDNTSNKPDQFNKLMESIGLAAQNSIPSQKHNYNSKALLLGNPIAVARGAARVRLKGLPALNQASDDYYKSIQQNYSTYKNQAANSNNSFDQFLSDLVNNNIDANEGYKDCLKYSGRIKNEWDKIQIYLRIGEINQYGDGLYGYWDDSQPSIFNAFEPSNDNDTTFYVPLSEPSNTNSIYLDKMQFFTFLMDARSGIHLTSGILPTIYKTMEVHHYQTALKNMAMWFNVSSLLQPAESSNGSAKINLPKIPGYQWHVYDQFNGERPISADELDTFQLTQNTLINTYLTIK